MELTADRLASESARESRFGIRVDVLTLTIVAYLFWFIATPYQSERLQFLETIRFERWLAALLIVFSLCYGRLENLFSGLSISVLCLFAFMAVSCLFSSYPNYSLAMHWEENYWKKMIFFACLVIALTSESRIDAVMRLLMLAIFAYQLYSMLDFLRGGSYVYQQGTKRMIGVWSGGGLGSANGFGFLGTFALPLVRYSYQLARSSRQRQFCVLAGILSLTCVVLTGTRGALIVAAGYMVFANWRAFLRWDRLLIVTVAGLLIIPALPEDIKHRYWSQIISAFSDEDEFETRTDEIASESAQGRIEGLKNGFRLGMNKPVFGYGPGTSAMAVHEITGESDFFLQLHNLYGQIAAELGLLGFGIWSLIIIGCWWTVWQIRKDAMADPEGPDSGLGIIAQAQLGLLFVLIGYGMVGHTLYSEKWLFVLGCVAGLRSIRAR